MKRLSAALFACLLPLPVLAGPPAAAPAKSSAMRPFTVEVRLSNQAATSLATIKETVIVAAYYYGLPAKGYESKADEMDEIQLGEEDVDLPGAGTASFTGAAIQAVRLPFIKDGAIQVLINVFSGRKSTNSNLLDCGFFEGSVAEAAKKPLTLQCSLIAEHRKPGNP
jgi:hypothetical protein